MLQPLLIYAQPGANSLAVEHEVLSAIKELKKEFPPGVDYKIIYDPTIFIAKSVREVVITIFIAILLVARRRFPVSAELASLDHPGDRHSGLAHRDLCRLYPLGISLNNFSLFGLVLAVGIRRRRCDRCGRKRRAQHASGMSATEAPQDDGRSWRGA